MESSNSNRVVDELILVKKLCKMIRKIPSIDKKYICLYMHNQREKKIKYFKKWKKYHYAKTNR
jgi:hypothetical protein